MVDFQPGTVQVHNDLSLTNFDFEIYYGGIWWSMNDHLNYRIAADSFADSQVSRRRITTQSQIYDGTFEVHSVKENVTENVNIYILGQSQEHITENLLLVLNAIDQPRYNCRKTMDDHRETWLCMPAEYVIDRTQVLAHNTLCELKMTIPRFPTVTYEVIL